MLPPAPADHLDQAFEDMVLLDLHFTRPEKNEIKKVLKRRRSKYM
jgi:hypothetical protein